jgi:N-acetylmuramoyl-L-alanine amidase CwlA
MTIDSSIRARWHGGKRPLSSIVAIVFHYTANTGTSATARGNARYFAETDRKASAHYCVDTGDTIFECVPLDTTAWSVGDGSAGPMGKIVCNSNSVSIEMVSCTDAAGRYYIPEATQRHAAELYQHLLQQLPSVRYTIRHYDVSLKRCPEPFIDEAKWAAFKSRLEDNMDQAQFDKMMDTYLAEQAKKEPSDWSAEAREWAEQHGIIAGNGKGGMQYKSPCTREQMVVFLKRFNDMD